MKVGGGGKRERKTTPRFDRSAHSSPSQSKAKAGKKEKEGGGGGRRGKSKAVAKATPVKIEGAGKSPAVGKKRTPGGTTKRTVVGVDDWKSRRMPNIGPRAVSAKRARASVSERERAKRARRRCCVCGALLPAFAA
jgi:hypothetical protein